MGQPYPKMAISRFEVAPELIGTPFTLTLTGENRFTLEVEGRVLEGQVGKLLEKEDVTLLVADVAAQDGQVFTLVKQPLLDVIGELQSGLQVSEKGKNTGIISWPWKGKTRDVFVLCSITSARTISSRTCCARPKKPRRAWISCRPICPRSKMT